MQGLNARGIKIAGGQDHLKGRIFRIGHLGWFGAPDIQATIATLEAVLGELGHPFQAGAGIAAANAVLEAR